MNWGRLIKGFLLSFVFLIFFAYLVSGVQYIFGDMKPIQETKTFNASVSEPVQSAVIQPTPEPSPEPDINAEAVISVESNLSDPAKVIFEKFSEVKLPIASLTKLMTAIIVLDNPEVYNFSDKIAVDSIANSQDALKQDVKLGDIFSIENFFDIMLIESSNRSAYTLAEKMGEPAFVDLMNKKAKEIGLKNTSFVDPTGLSSQDISTASDLAKLAEYILKNYPAIADTTKIKNFNIPKLGDIKNSDELLGQIPEIVCSKTGFTTQAKGCLLLIINNSKNNDYIINVILGADERFLEMKKLISNCN